MPQKDPETARRTDDENKRFGRAIGCMSSCYASITGTAVLQLKQVPERPKEYDGWVAVHEVPKGGEDIPDFTSDKQAVEQEMTRFGEVLLVEDGEPWYRWKVRFREHADAEKAVNNLCSQYWQETAEGWALDTLYNGRKYEGVGGRGWCIFEGGVSLTVALHLAEADRKEQLPLRFAVAQHSRAKVTNISDAQPDKYEKLLKVCRPEDLKQRIDEHIDKARFTGKGDEKTVKGELDKFFRSITKGLTMWQGQANPASGQELGAVALEMAGACWILPEFSGRWGESSMITTLQLHVARALASAGGRLGAEVKENKDPTTAVREVFGPGSPLSNMAMQTVGRATHEATAPKGLLDVMHSKLMAEVIKVFLAGVPREHWPKLAIDDGYADAGPPPRLEACLKGHSLVTKLLDNG